ncbi:MAG: hypothetical protein M1816_006895 [Peltula sp. TS41687]|nr:MAG: hypothetical protein M1816_006895 [Peltula sp. TS41687]
MNVNRSYAKLIVEHLSPPKRPWWIPRRPYDSSSHAVRRRRKTAATAISTEQGGLTALRSLYEIEELSRKSSSKDKYLPIWDRSSASENGIRIAEGTSHPRKLNISVEGEVERFDVLFLRDACSCPLCVDPSTRQRLFQTSDIPSDLTVQSTSLSRNGDISIRWVNDIPGYPDSHTTQLTRDFLTRYASLRNRMRARHNDQRHVLWDREIMKADVRWLRYDDYMSRDAVLYEALKQLSLYGLVFLSDVPSTEAAVERIGLRIGPLKDTLYGRTWNVRSVANAKNIAYTNQDLGFHMDLLYFASPPGLLLLHCLRNSVRGGSSLFADTFRAATLVRLNSRMLYTSLLNFPVTYQYVNDGHHYTYTHPTIELEKFTYRTIRTRVANVNWSPPFQAPFEADIGDDDEGCELRRYLAAAKAFSAHFQAPSAQFELRLMPGQCVIFNNRRVVHARRAFELDGGWGDERWLRGAYVDTDAWLSKSRVFSERFAAREGYGDGNGNGDEFRGMGEEGPLFGKGRGRGGGDEYI